MALLKKHLVFIVFLTLFGCAGPGRIAVYHSFPATPADVARFEAFQQSYLVINRPAHPKSVILIEGGKNGKKAVSRPYFYVNAQGVAAQFNQELKKHGSSLMAYRVSSESVENDPYLDQLNPSSVIEIKFNTFTAAERVDIKQIQKTDSEGNLKTEEVKEWTYTASIHVSYTARSGKDGSLISKGVYKNSKQEILKSQNSSKMTGLKNILQSHAVRSIVNDLAPASVVRHRPLYRVKEQDDSNTAYQLARKNKWEEAELIWGTRLSSGTGTWEDQFNLAVAAEAQHKNALAQTRYEKAREMAGEDKKAASLLWDEIHSDVTHTRASVSELTKEAKHWFGRRVAVLPFSDEVVNLDGPDLIRDTVYQVMKRGGYNVVPLDEVTETLRRHGFSEGGQFYATTPEKLAGWLKADWLVFGHIEEFNEVNVGVYAKQAIKGELWFWDAEKKQKVWSSQVPLTFHGLPSEFSTAGIVAHFLGNLAKTWIEHAKDKPLAQESRLFVMNNLETIPFRP